MNPLTEMLLPQFVTFVGLLCNWSQERSAQKGDEDMTFLVWLEHHNFRELSEQLRAHSDLVQRLSELQSSELSRLRDQLGSASDALVAVASRLELLAPLVPRSQEGARQVSAQAVTVLQQLASRDAAYLYFEPELPPRLCVRLEFEDIDIPYSEAAFLADDLGLLVSLGFLRVLKSDPHWFEYSLTRTGKTYAEQATSK